jgi:hypothetical protein
VRQGAFQQRARHGWTQPTDDGQVLLIVGLDAVAVEFEPKYSSVRKPRKRSLKSLEYRNSNHRTGKSSRRTPDRQLLAEMEKANLYPKRRGVLRQGTNKIPATASTAVAAKFE